MEEPALTFRIRGIYSTSLTRLLLENGFKPTQCSKTLLSRFKLEELFTPPDVDIYDTKQKDGVVIEGKREAVERVLDVIEKRLEDAMIREVKPGVNCVFKGVVKENTCEGAIVDLGEGLGILPGQRLREGEEVVVAVVKCVENGLPILSMGPRVVGSYAKLIPGDRVSLSRGIKYRGKALELQTLGRALKPPKWGLRWRRSAQYASIEKLMQEVKELERRGEELLKLLDRASAPSKITEGDSVYIVSMLGSSKEKLDALRAEVTPTMPRHHLFKSWGKPFALLVDLVEAIGGKLEGFMEKASNLLLERGLRAKEQVEIVHVKPDGRVINLRPGKIIEVDGGKVKLYRRFKGGGFYDGLDEAKEEGDYGVTVFKEGRWWCYTMYFSKDHRLKGVYFNISTPPEYMPGRIKYLDLGVDVVWSPKRGVKVVDEEEVKKLVEEGALPKRLADKALEEALRLAKEIGEGGLLEEEGITCEPASN